MAGKRIIVDGVFFQDHRTGIARVWREILVEWQRMPIGPRVTVLRRGSLPAEVDTLAVVDVPLFDYADASLDRKRLQQVCDTHQAGVFLSTYFTRALSTPALLMVHDLIPERFGTDLMRPDWAAKQDAIRRAGAFACVSRNTLDDLLLHYPDVRGTPHAVIHNGVSEAFRPVTQARRRQFLDRHIAPHLGEGPYVLFVGHAHVRYKNARLLAAALRLIAPGKYGLLLTDPSAHSREMFRDIPGLAIHAVRLSDSDLAAAYGTAHCLVYPSLYEGFGLPVVEAMACGCPVVCSDRGALPEVAGQAAITIDPRRPDLLAAALDAVAAPGPRADLIARGLANASRYRWDRAAAQLGALAEMVADRT